MNTELPDYAELHCLSAFSFQRGASIAMELFERAAALGYKALAITDEGSLAGIVRAKQAADATGIKLIVGSEVRIDNGPKLVLLVENREGYVALCRLLTTARMRAKKGQYRLLREDIADTDGLLALWLPDDVGDVAEGAWLKQAFPQRAWLAVELHRGPDDAARLTALTALGQQLDLPLVASGDVHMHVRSRRKLQDVMTAIRHKTTLAEAGYRLFPNGERHLRTRKALAAVYPRTLLDESVRIAERCVFELTTEALGYTYPSELVPVGHTTTTWLRHLTEEGIRWRWPHGESKEVRKTIELELDLIQTLKYESFFLTVHDVVWFARNEGILCQGRGSAANSAVCYALGITSVNPDEMKLMFGRFLSQERNEPPDIDVDFEHERREEVLQYVFKKYSRQRAALAAVAIQYRGRSAIRDVARAMGVSQDLSGELAGMMDRWAVDVPIDQHLRERGFDPDTPLLRNVVDLTEQLIGFPRHLSQHPGGFVISQQPLYTMVPTENAAMDDRSVIQWDKDDLEYLGLLKVDCLALGMLTAIRKTFRMLGDTGRGDWTLARILDEKGHCKKTYEMICKADTIGVFQIESRAQMAMLPRLRPEKFYDLVVEVAIVRPGPIQGDMVHPYLRRRQGLEPVDYPSEALKDVLERTLGIPLFQEQVMKIAVVAADYSEGQADELRRSMAAWRRNGHIERHRERLIGGMLKNNYEPEFAERLFRQIQGFGDYGFPESHAASFALLAYVSSWLKCHEPAAFTCGLINSAPMGFYTADQLLQDARRHDVRVLPVDVRYSHWDCTLEDARNPDRQPAIRMGLRLVAGFREDVANAIVEARDQAAFTNVADLCRRARLDSRQSGLLADAGALRALAGHRHRARWAVTGVEPQRPLFGEVPEQEEIHLPLPSVEENMLADYAMTGTTLGPHPLKLLRAQLRARRCRGSADLQGLPHGRLVRTAGLVTLRQKPGTSSGVIFMSLEDEDGTTNVVVWHDLAVRQRRVLLESRLMAVEGRLETESGVRHVIAHRLEDLSPMLGALAVSSRDFH
ncbi:error-prone DNA polymerase [Dyella sp. GSA-30]|uniref:error-prone DNA polymerase n=1 Tax=Dyella sp. GSA-30 TaxID=2994496 RepID=UPI0024914ECA|nr:error-prone DNA polymerase [Dyella sp. GSA-30]BDU23153.1 error-prone DNA polymerase [Dyella sp. GSA-30]